MRADPIFSQLSHTRLDIIASIPTIPRLTPVDALYLVILLALFFVTVGLVIAVEHMGDDS